MPIADGAWDGLAECDFKFRSGEIISHSDPCQIHCQPLTQLTNCCSCARYWERNSKLSWCLPGSVVFLSVLAYIWSFTRDDSWNETKCLEVVILKWGWNDLFPFQGMRSVALTCLSGDVAMWPASKLGPLFLLVTCHDSTCHVNVIPDSWYLLACFV